MCTTYPFFSGSDGCGKANVSRAEPMRRIGQGRSASASRETPSRKGQVLCYSGPWNAMCGYMFNTTSAKDDSRLTIAYGRHASGAQRHRAEESGQLPRQHLWCMGRAIWDCTRGPSHRMAGPQITVTRAVRSTVWAAQSASHHRGKASAACVCKHMFGRPVFEPTHFRRNSAEVDRVRQRVVDPQTCSMSAHV